MALRPPELEGRTLAEAVQRRDAAEVRSLLSQRPELVNMELAENDERTALHHAVLGGDAEMTRLLMRAGADLALLRVEGDLLWIEAATGSHRYEKELLLPGPVDPANGRTRK